MTAETLCLSVGRARIEARELYRMEWGVGAWWESDQGRFDPNATCAQGASDAFREGKVELRT